MANLSAGDASLESDQAFERLGRALDDLQEGGHLYDESVQAGGARRVRMSRTYLWLLGYLKKDNNKDVIDEDYRAAVRLLEVDLEREPSGVLDGQAWKMLCEVAPYDSDVDVARWFDADTASPLLGRAVHLRLFSYGLLAHPPTPRKLSGSKLTKQRKALTGAFEDFARATNLLGLSGRPLAATANVELVTLLFAHSALTRGLSPSNRGFEVFAHHPDLPLGASGTRKLLKRFLGNLALVELWLLGYEVRPGNFAGEGPHGNERKGTLFFALNKFANDREITVGNRRSISVGAWFFAEARQIQDTEVETATVDDAQITRVLANPRQMKELKKAYRSLGVRIIDGVKRAVAWVIGWFKRVVRVVKQLIRNIARALHRGALLVYRRLQAIVRVTAMGFSYFLSSPVGGSDPDGVYVRKRADFDMEVVIHPEATSETIEVFFNALALRVRAMRLGGRIIGELWRLIRQVISVTNAVLGWLGMVFALVMLGNWLRRSAAIARESLDLIEEFSGLTSSA